MALIGQPSFPTTSGNVAITTAAWSGLGRRFPIEPTIIDSRGLWVPAQSGAEILASGQYEATFNFSFETTDTTTEIRVRGNAVNADGPGTPVRYCAPSTGDKVNGSFKFFSNVSVSDLLAGRVYILLEAASLSGSETITWLHSQISIKRIGAAQ